MIEQSSLFESMTAEAAFDGRPAQLFELKNKRGMRIVLMDVGAAWLSCKVPVDGGCREVLLGQNNMADFQLQQSYMGVIVGRVANRIAKGQFSIAGVAYQVDTNQAGNTLHGGTVGFDKRRWVATDNREQPFNINNNEKNNENSIEFALVSPDGDQGFPGELTVRVKYQLTDNNEVVISYSGHTTQATPINLTNHAYFNLLGADSGQLALTHSLSINSDAFVPTNEVGIPTGEWQKVQGGYFDFSTEKCIEQDFMLDAHQQAAKGYDHAFILAKSCLQGALAARLISPDNLLTLNVFTTKPAMQLYTGNWLADTPDRMGGQYQDYAGIALETQFVADAMNNLQWDHPNVVLQPAETYQHQTSYQFTV
ncbi:galactose-1-epimerase [Moritella sp. F3]|uniref:galactose-1-epimerase n=1 Tax=Moritella sp. F3 TaxID=2718882 RepID=UPI001A1FE84B|nr:galactose-1-epimerase [Moritella sp. F3]GIC75426.1 aldose 1-epimerase [Moritella sp. F1]GIC80571.1 aldose 1-epimerase [Moritella sp. F3]